MKITIEHDGKVKCYEKVEGYIIAGETEDAFFSGATASGACDWKTIVGMVIKGIDIVRKSGVLTEDDQ